MVKVAPMKLTRVTNKGLIEKPSFQLVFISIPLTQEQQDIIMRHTGASISSLDLTQDELAIISGIHLPA